MTENPATEQSMLAPHRVKPYHFKGLNEDQKGAIMHERAQQMREAEMKKQTEQEEARLGPCSKSTFVDNKCLTTVL